MRPLIIIIGLMILTTYANYVYSQQKDTVNDNSIILKVDILFPTIQAAENNKFVIPALTVEKCFNRRQSIQLTLGYFNNSTTDNDKNTKRNGFLIQPSYKYYLSIKKNHRGFYTGASLAFTYSHKTETDLEYKRYLLAAYGLIGYQNYIANRIVIDGLFGAGAGYIINTKILYQSSPWAYSPVKNYYFRGILILNIGYRFNCN